MFTGIVENQGEIKDISQKADGYIFSIDCGDLDITQVKIGSSICVSGVCLTVTKIDGKTFEFEVMPETLRKTVLGSKKAGDKINLEGSLKMGDEISGHFVFGHIDGVGEVLDVVNEGDDRLITIRPPQDLMKYLCPQGSVSVDGVSLTVARLSEESFAVALIEHTLNITTLGQLKVGDKVNIETDMLAKYVFSQAKHLKF